RYVNGQKIESKMVWRAWIRPVTLIDLVRLLFWVALTVYAYTWLKIFVPLLNTHLYDPLMYRIHNFLHFGIDPTRFLIALFPQPWFLHFLDWEYTIYYPTMVAGAAWFMATPSRSERFRFVAAFLLLWVASSWLYVAIPVLSPCYALPGDFTHVHQTMPKIALFQEMLIHHYALIKSPQKANALKAIIPIFGCAAFPSLHVAAQCLLALWARRRNRILFILFGALTFITFLASLISGCHYAVDGYVGILMAVLLVWIFEKKRKREPATEVPAK